MMLRSPHLSCELGIYGPNAELTIAHHKEKISRHSDDCGIDLFPNCHHESDVLRTIYGSHAVVNIPTGVHILLPIGTFGWVTDRSSTPDKLFGHGISEGKIDSGYTGQYYVRVLCPSNHVEMVIATALKLCETKVALAQLVVLPFLQCGLQILSELPITSRGNNGYGSTDELAGLMRHKRIIEGRPILGDVSPDAARNITA